MSSLDTCIMFCIMFRGSENKKMSSTIEFCSNLPTESQFRCHYHPSIVRLATEKPSVVCIWSLLNGFVTQHERAI